MTYDVIILGSGPAGLTAALYSARNKLKTLVLEGNQPGGQLTTTTTVENWPGNIAIQGPDLMTNIREHAAHYGAELATRAATAVDFAQYPYVITAGKKTFSTKTVIIATGSSNKKLGCLGEQEYFAKGVATCATCDAPFYKDRDVIVVGGGNTAVTEIEHLTHFAQSVTVVHILEQLTATDPIKDKILHHPKVTFIYESTIKEIKGNGTHVTSAIIEHQKTKALTEIRTDGIFIAIGFTPNTQLFQGQLELDQYGYLILQDRTCTSKRGVFAAGDVSDYRYRQAIVSAGAGCMAALDVQAFLAKEL
ncbi:thioredoxin-disulfide reductase [Candidatus Dependentiae bacterium]|nr:thioredoxin-disulfide reductase [Candidatus Dependentiae bacterium]